jgi:hypothetical protein
VIETWLAVGTGIAFGWIIRDVLGRKKLDPDVIRAARAQIQEVRAEHDKVLAHEREARESDRQAFEGLLASAQSQVNHYVQQLLTAPKPRKRSKKEEPPLFPEEVDIASAVRLATQGPDQQQKVRDALMAQKGLTREEADAILKGEYEGLPPGERLDLFIADSLRDQTGIS